MTRSFFYIKAAAIFVGLSLITSSFTSSTPDTTEQKKRTIETQNNKEPVKYVVADFTEVAKKSIPAVVSIQVESKRKASIFSEDQASDPYDFFGNNDLWGLFGFPKKESSRSQPVIGQASGVIVSPEGYILTNSHVVHDMDIITVLMHDGRELQAKVLGDDPNTDLALVKIEAKDLPYLKLGNSDALEVGQWVAAVGNPFGMQATMTAGIVSAKNRNNLDIAHYEDFIQTDAAINRGNSGGPLMALNGEVVGINTAIATNAASGYLGIGFAIPINVAKHVMEEILSNGKVSHGFLGISLQSIDYNLAQAFNLKKVGGALVTSVVKDSPADKAGIKVEDVILKVNKKEVDSAASLRNAVYILKPGTSITLTIMRKDQTLELPVTITDFKDEVAVSAPQKTNLGIEVDNLTSDVARSLGYVDEQGVIITKVYPNSAAGLAGLKKGALIIGVNRQRVENIHQFNEALKEASPDRPILLQIKQGSQYLFLSLRPE